MKKITLLSILILCLVVGGVYATWDYAQGKTGDQTSTISINLRAANVAGAKGNIGAKGSSSFNFYIDDTDGNHKADSFIGEGNITITFTPSTSADTEVQQKGIVLEYVLSTDYTLAEYQYKGVQVFLSVDSTPQVLNSGNPTKEVIINGSDIAKLVELNPELHLATKAEYDEFYRTLASHGFLLTIREKVVPVATP